MACLRAETPALISRRILMNCSLVNRVSMGMSSYDV
jgi:hypothetical protein